MSFSSLNKREQVLILLIISVLILGSYIGFRVWPVYTEIQDLKKQTKKTEKKLMKSRIPDEPTEDLDELEAQLDDQKLAMELITQQAEALQLRLASFDSQELKVRISQLARENMVMIKSNETMKLQPVKFIDPANKKRKKRATKIDPNEVLVLPESSGWEARMSPGTVFHRPMQKLQIEGTYGALRKFIHGLESLPWQVTIIKMNIQQMPIAPPVGYSQRLQAELVLAL